LEFPNCLAIIIINYTPDITAHCQSTFHGEYQSWEAHPIDEFSLDEPDDMVEIACDGA
jgi:hypothetical protein